MRSKFSSTLALLLLISVLAMGSNFQPAKAVRSSQAGLVQAASSVSNRELSWMAGKPLPVINGRVIFPPLPPQEPAPSYYTHWFAGSIYPSSLASQNASTISVSITVPSSEPRPEQYYYVILSAFDSNGSYDQIGFCAYYGVWGLSYSWTTGSPYPGSVVYIYDPIAMILSPGVTYTFSITTQAGVTYFAAYQGSRTVWSLAVSTGGDYLILSNYYSAGKRGRSPYDYTDYEEVYYTSTPGGAPDFNFTFFNNIWTSTNGSLYDTIWTPWYSPDPGFQVPSNVQVLINGNSVLVENPESTLAPKPSSGKVYIEPDGSINPSTAPIKNVGNITYALTDNTNDSIVVLRNNVIVDGAGYTLKGTGNGTGIILSGRSNVTIRNIKIKAFDYGVYLNSSSNNTLSGDTIADNSLYGVYLSSSSNNTFSGNNIIDDNGLGVCLEYYSNYNTFSQNNVTDNNVDGFYLYYSSNCTFSENNVTDNNDDGVYLYCSSNSTFMENNIIANDGYGVILDYSCNYCTFSVNNITNNNYNWGIYLDYFCNYNTFSINNITNNYWGGVYLDYFCNYNTLWGNTIANNYNWGVYLESSSNNRFFYNNFGGNAQQVISDGSPNTWDNGYPSGGNYWSDYLTTYPSAAENDSSGIWNTPYIIDSSNIDGYPLMAPFNGYPLAITSIASFKKVLVEGGSTNVNITVKNGGSLAEMFDLTLYGNSRSIYTFTNVTLAPGSTTTLTATGLRFAVGLYTLSAHVYNAYVYNTYKGVAVWVMPIAPLRPWFLLYTGDGWCGTRFWHPPIPV
ncbi:MAG TPA: NosD domain-containing protein [Candidatus Bathyarchaeia archaeon]|nr:NosD domain-containing protein [Candidatus Bathyarchaeia archaeon]